MSAVRQAHRVGGQGIVLARRPLPITVSKGSLVPLALLAAVFASFSAGAPAPLTLAAAAVGGLGGVVSLIVHELGHVRATRRLKGVEPVHVSLLWFGAGTWFEGAYRSGRDQMKVAIAGPSASLALAIVLVASSLLPVPRAVALGLFGLAFLNAAIALVSLIPVQPLDGHNFLVGLLWLVAGSQQAARTIVRRVSKAWLAAEAVGCAALTLHSPRLGSCALEVVASLVAQWYVTARPARPRPGATRRPAPRRPVETPGSF